MDTGRADIVSDLWLWSERGGVRWWSNDDTGCMQIESPYARDEPLDIKILRDARQEYTLRGALQKALVDVIESALRSHARVRLRLTEDLNDHWHTCPYEHLMVDGRALFRAAARGALGQAQLRPPTRPGYAGWRHSSSVTARRYVSTSSDKHPCLLVQKTAIRSCDKPCPFSTSEGSEPAFLPLCYCSRYRIRQRFAHQVARRQGLGVPIGVGITASGHSFGLRRRSDTC